MTIEHVTNHKEQMLARLMYAFRNRPNITALLTVIASRYQGVEDALFQLVSERGIETGEGVQLDVIGKIVGQPRGDSADDDAYRLRLKARMRANQSSGTGPDILDVFATLLAGYSDLHLEQYFPASLVLSIENTAITEATAILYASFLEAAKAGGVQAFLLTSPTDAQNTFTFPMSTTLTAEQDGHATVHVVSTAGFQSSGSLFLDPGSSDQLRLTYTSKTATTFEGCNEAEGAFGPRAPGSIVVEAPYPNAELTGAFDLTSDITIPIGDTSAFPSAGFVMVGRSVDPAEHCIVEYTGKTATHLTGVTDTGTGTETLFLAGTFVSWMGNGFSEEFQPFGGQLASVTEA